jgi:hypothetical protein
MARGMTLWDGRSFMSLDERANNAIGAILEGQLSNPCSYASEPSISFGSSPNKQLSESNFFHLFYSLSHCLYIYYFRSQEPRAVARDL